MIETASSVGAGHVMTVPDAPPQRDVDRAATDLAKVSSTLLDTAEQLASRLGSVLADERPNAALAEARTIAVCSLSGTLDDSRHRVERATAVLNDLTDRLQV